MKTTRNGKAIAPVVDIFPQICVSHHDDARVDEEMRLLKEFGFDRVYFVLCNPGFPMFSNPWLSLQPPGVASENHSFQSLVSLGYPNFAYLHACHRHGMEAFAVMKPYECGGGSSVPHGAKLPLDPVRYETIGGERIGFDNLIGSRPDLRVKRRPIPDYERLVSQPVIGMTASFCVDPIAEVDYPGYSNADPDELSTRFHLYASRDNGHYEKVTGDFKCSGRFDSLALSDPNGRELSGGPKRCFTLEFSNLTLPAEVNYLALVIERGGELRSIPQTMITLWGADGEIPVTLSEHVRRGGNEGEAKKSSVERSWGMEQSPKQVAAEDIDAVARAFAEWGFEFEWLGTGFGSYWKGHSVYGIAKGKLKYMKGTPCEACPEVQDYWLDWADKCVEMGFDGIDFRLQNHSGMVSDYANYGFNEEIVERYRETYGEDMFAGSPDALRVMAVRGMFFTEFLEAAAERLHRSDRKVQIHLRHCHEFPKDSHLLNQLGFWAMPKVWYENWRHLIDLSDEVTIKDYFHNHYQAGNASGIKAYAAGQGKRVWVHCYIAQGLELNSDFFAAVENDDLVGGVLLYETTHSNTNEVNLGLIEQYGPVGLYEPVAKMLRKILEVHDYRQTS